MKKTGKRVIAVVLALIMTVSVFSVGAIALTSLLTKNLNSVTEVADGSTVINANSIEEAMLPLAATKMKLLNTAPKIMLYTPQLSSPVSASPSLTLLMKTDTLYTTKMVKNFQAVFL